MKLLSLKKLIIIDHDCLNIGNIISKHSMHNFCICLTLGVLVVSMFSYNL